MGQIVLLAKHIRGKGWKTLSIPCGESESYKKAVPGYKLGARSDSAQKQ
ncbi:MAG: hypothetical protein ACRD36_03150 [Candidatus Acidiferrum sp.]